MDNTLAQILNDMLIAQRQAQQFANDLQALKDEHAKCPKPEVKPEDLPGASAGTSRKEGLPVTDPAEHSA